MVNVHTWLELLRQEIVQIDAIQIGVLIFGVSEVLLARANSIWLYPTGIIATVLGIFSLFSVQLYAECLLHAYYLVMSIYGWWYWSAKEKRKPVEITFATSKDWIITVLFAFGGSVFLFSILTHFTDSEVPAWDAWVSATGWAGMWLLTRRKIENWLLLNISNAFAIPLLFYKGLPLLALLTIFLFIVACKGYVDWIRIARKRVLHENVTTA